MSIITPQFILFIMGIIAFVVSVVLVVIAVRIYFKLDIRSVMDDLAGRSRGASSRSVKRMQRRRTVSRGIQVGAESKRTNTGSQSSSDVDNEDAANTEIHDVMTDTPQPGTSAQHSPLNLEDFVPTIVSAWDQPNDISTIKVKVESKPNGSEDVSSALNSLFVLEKRIVILHSDEIISVW